MREILVIFVKLTFRRYICFQVAGLLIGLFLLGVGLIELDLFVVISTFTGMAGAVHISRQDLGSNFVWLLTAPISRKSLWMLNLKLNLLRAFLIVLAVAVSWVSYEVVGKIPGYNDPEVVVAEHSPRAAKQSKETPLEMPVFGRQPWPYLIFVSIGILGIFIILPLPMIGGSASLERYSSQSETSWLYYKLPAAIATICVLNLTLLPPMWPFLALNFILACFWISALISRASAFQLRLPKVVREKYLTAHMIATAAIVALGLLTIGS